MLAWCDPIVQASVFRLCALISIGIDWLIVLGMSMTVERCLSILCGRCLAQPPRFEGPNRGGCATTGLGRGC